MGEERRVRDPIHGFIRLSGDEAEIVETPVFQRLRGIRQLAMANMVYPGALHTRFDHTLGVFHVASLLCDVFQFPDEDRRLVKLSALVHDLGHGPFSHVSEGALELFADREKLRERLKADEAAKIHELVTQDVLHSDPDLNHFIDGNTISKIISLLSRGYGEPILRSVVSGPLDADKQDYLLRDTYFCGVKYGIFDLQQLHRELRSEEDPTQGKQLTISDDGVHALEQFVLAKYYLTAQVYSHRVRLITDQMIVRAIKLGIDEDQIEELGALYRYDGSEAFVKNYMQWDDARFILTFGDAKLQGKYCREIIERLRSRRLLKQVFTSLVGQLPESHQDVVRDITNPKNRAIRRKLEKELATVIERVGFPLKSECGDPSNLVIANSYTLKSVRAQSRNDEGPILVKRGTAVTTFEEASDLFHSIDEKMVRPHFAVYAPVEYHNPAERRAMQAKLHEPIMTCLGGFGNGQ
jgi:HD superfamily phosphohydrolase